MESGNEIPFLFWPLMVVILVYMATFLYLLSYLRRVHNPFWVDMGSISLQNFAEKNPIQSFSDSFRLLGLFFGSRCSGQSRAARTTRRLGTESA